MPSMAPTGNDYGTWIFVVYNLHCFHSWWQSPTLQSGQRYQWITINVNLRQVYQVEYVSIKSAISPLPANWILERSIDGINYSPWQYFAQTDTECWERYRIRPTIGKVRYRTDDEVVCTSYYSKNETLDNGEVIVRLNEKKVKLFFADQCFPNKWPPKCGKIGRDQQNSARFYQSKVCSNQIAKNENWQRADGQDRQKSNATGKLN